MPLDAIAASTQSDGRWKIALVPKGSNPLSVAILKGSTAKNLTYSFTPDGFNYRGTTSMVEDKRLTLIQDLSRTGKVKYELDLKYVSSDDADSAAALLTAGLEGFFVIRRAKDNATDWTVGDKVDVIPFQLAVQIDDAPVENGVDTISQAVAITGAVQRRVALVA